MVQPVTSHYTLTELQGSVKQLESGDSWPASHMVSSQFIGKSPVQSKQQHRNGLSPKAEIPHIEVHKHCECSTDFIKNFNTDFQLTGMHYASLQ
jgi:hypothetical protein